MAKKPKIQKLPKAGSFYAYKKGTPSRVNHFGEVLIKLWVPAKALRVQGKSQGDPNYEGKIRVSMARVIWIKFIDHINGMCRVINGKKGSVKTACPLINSRYHVMYKVGKIVKPEHAFDPDPGVTCTSGIHCFMSKETALNY